MLAWGGEGTYCGVISVDKARSAVRIVEEKGQWLTHASIDFGPAAAL